MTRYRIGCIDPKSLKFASSLNSTDGAESDRLVCVHGRSLECLQRRVRSVIVKSGLLEAAKKSVHFVEKRAIGYSMLLSGQHGLKWSALR